ncbi:unnamed protein product, partial [Iphiclides podalirius]
MDVLWLMIMIEYNVVAVAGTRSSLRCCTNGQVRSRKYHDPTNDQRVVEELCVSRLTLLKVKDPPLIQEHMKPPTSADAGRKPIEEKKSRCRSCHKKRQITRKHSSASQCGRTLINWRPRRRLGLIFLRQKTTPPPHKRTKTLPSDAKQPAKKAPSSESPLLALRR